jgi:hypothetical protein
MDDELRKALARQEEMISQLITMVASTNQIVASSNQEMKEMKVMLEKKMDDLKSDFRQVRRITFAIETDLDETINRVGRIEDLNQ